MKAYLLWALFFNGNNPHFIAYFATVAECEATKAKVTEVQGSNLSYQCIQGKYFLPENLVATQVK